MNDAVQQALAQAELYLDDRRYCLIHLPVQAITPAAAVLAEGGMAFSALIADKDEVTLVLGEELLEMFADRLPEHEAQCGYRLITFDLPLNHDMVGFLSIVSAALAEAKTPIMAYSAYERDHLLIHESHFEEALQTLQALQARARNLKTDEG